MSDDYSILVGELAEMPGKEKLNAALAAGGFTTNVGEYAIRINGFEEFVFRHLKGDIGDPVVSASHDSADDLAQYAALVSAALRQADIAHRFEIYDSTGDLFASQEHRWQTRDNRP